MTLADLVVDKNNLDEEALELIIKPYVRIIKQGGEVQFTPLAANLSIKQKILVYLLAKKAVVTLKLGSTEEAVTPRELEATLGVKGNSLRPILRRLYNANAIMTGNGHYWVGNYILANIKEKFFSDREGGEVKNE